MIRFGIVGAGKIASKFARDIQCVDKAKLVAIASRDLSKAIEFKEQHHIEYAFGSYEDMAKSDLIDAVYIATPHNFHMEQSILFMNHKKHVLCEKPISVNQKEFEIMVEVATRNNVLLMEAMWTSFLPVTLEINKIVEAKKFGNIKHMNIEFGFEFLGKGGDEGRLFNPKLAGGSLLDVGIYPVAYTFNITNQPIKKMTSKATMYPTGVDSEVIIDLVYEDLSTARLVSSFIENKKQSAILEFEHGTIVVDQFWSGERASINDEVKHFPMLGEGFPYEIASFIDTLEKHEIENHIMTHDRTRKCIKMLDDIRKQIGLVYPFE